MERAMKRKFSKPVRWADICRVMRMFGLMEDYSKAEAFRLNKRLEKQIKLGKAEKVKRGWYRARYE
jgi:hypothetical protein